MKLDDTIMKRINEWTHKPYMDDCIKDITSLVDEKNENELNER